MLYSGVILKQATTALRRCLDRSLCHTIFLDLYGRSVWRKTKKKNKKKWLNIEENKRVTCICGNRPHQLNVEENSRNFLNSLHNLLRCISVFSFTWGLLIQSHLPAHSWVLNLQTDRDVYTQTLILYLRCFLHLAVSVLTFPCRCRLFCRNSLTSSSVSFCNIQITKEPTKLILHSAHYLSKVWGKIVFFLKKYFYLFFHIHFLFSKDALNWSKVTVKIFIIIQKIKFQINAVLFKKIIHQRIFKINYDFHKIY